MSAWVWKKKIKNDWNELITGQSMLDPRRDPHPGKIDLTQKHQAHPENSEIPTLTQLSEPQKFSELTQIPGWATNYAYSSQRFEKPYPEKQIALMKNFEPTQIKLYK